MSEEVADPEPVRWGVPKGPQPIIGGTHGGVETCGDICWVKCRLCNWGLAHTVGQYWKDRAYWHAKEAPNHGKYPTFMVYSFKGTWEEFEFHEEGLDQSLHNFKSVFRGISLEVLL